MYCPKCGHEVPDDAVFCTKCGARQQITSSGEIKPSHIKASSKSWIVPVAVLGGFLSVVLIAVIVMAANGFFGGIQHTKPAYRIEGETATKKVDESVETDEITSEAQTGTAKDATVNTEMPASVVSPSDTSAANVSTLQKDPHEITAEITSDKEEYILPESNSRYISETELAKLTDEELRLARNELYARHGRMFDDPVLRAYFSSKTWYDGIVPPDQFSEDVFNQYEIANRDLIVRNEEKRKGNH